MLYISFMKLSLSVLAFLCLFSICGSYGQQSGIVTNGIDDYWDPSERQLFEFFTRKYWAARKVNHHYELHFAPLFVRLEDESKRIEALRSLGKNEKAEEVVKRTNEINHNTVSYLLENFSGQALYFYYGRDAKAIFNEQDYSKLYIDNSIRAKDVKVDKIAYVLIYASFHRGLSGKAYSLNIWDKESVFRLKGRKYNYDYFFNFSSTPLSSLKIFSSRVEDEKR